MSSADDLSIQTLKDEMDNSIWKNPKIFSAEKPWYYYVNAFQVKDSVTELEKIKSICEVNEQITILNCETGLRKLVQVGAYTGEQIRELAADLVNQLNLVPSLGVSSADMETAWNAMVQRLENYGITENYDPSWWNPNQHAHQHLPARA